MELECEIAGANSALMKLPFLFVLGRYDLRMSTSRAFKGSPVMVGLIGWLDA
jgi:hypothetical protein